MALRLITPPTSYPVTLAEVKTHLNIDHTRDDNLIEDIFIPAATARLDGKGGRLNMALEPQTWELTWDAFPCGPIQIPLGPLISIDSVKYDDEDGVEQTISISDYTVDTVTDSGWVVPDADFTWPDTLDGINAVRVRFTAGHAQSSGPVSNVPPLIKAAILMIVGDMYQNRESASFTPATQIPVNASVQAIIEQYRVFA